jgi:hypothetical protein
MDYNWTAATYHPIQGIWRLGKAAPLVWRLARYVLVWVRDYVCLGGRSCDRSRGAHSRQGVGSCALAKPRLGSSDLCDHLYRLRASSACNEDLTARSDVTLDRRQAAAVSSDPRVPSD